MARHSDVLCCFNCNFKKAIKSEVESLIIIRTHNLGRADKVEPDHILRILKWEELQSVNSLPYYEGNVYRALCACGDILDRRSQAGIEYAMAQHELNIKEEDKHDWVVFEDVWISYDESGLAHREEIPNQGNMKVVRIIKREDFVANTSQLDTRYWEAYHSQKLTDADLAKTTEITTYDPNIAWSNRVKSFNYINNNVWYFLAEKKCPAKCTLDFDTFRELYWHYYRVHYQGVGKTLTREELDEINEEYRMLKTQDIKPKRIAQLDKILEPYREYWTWDLHTYRDTVISMLQQIVLLEQSRIKVRGGKGKGKKGHTFSYNRFANALYQLNRKHGISQTELTNFCLEHDFVSQGGTIGERLFHGMVWSERDAPEWLDAIIKEYGAELGI